MTTATFICGYVLRFPDRAEGRELHRGERVADAIPAIAVSTGEHADAAVYVMPAEEWDAIWNDAEPAREEERR